MATTVSPFGSVSEPITVTNDPATSQGFSLSAYAAALVMVDAVSAEAPVTLTFYAKSDPSLATTYLLTDASNVAISQTTQAGRCFTLPEAAFRPFRYVIPVVSTGTATLRVATKA